MKEDFVRKFPSYTSCVSLLAKPLYDNTREKSKTLRNQCRVANINEKNGVGENNDISLMDFKYESEKYDDLQGLQSLTQKQDIPGVCERTKHNRKVEFDISRVRNSQDLMETIKVSLEKGSKNHYEDSAVCIKVSEAELSEDSFTKDKSQKTALKVNNGRREPFKIGSVENGGDKKIPTASRLHWLRVFPLKNKESRGLCDRVLSWTLSQVGLAVLLIVWSTIWAFVIYLTEGPSENQNAHELMKKQNDLVIELATELRQINPLSSSWMSAIQRHVDDARALGTRKRYFDFPGCVLFAVKVLTALGLGAPVPQSTAGRIATFIFAVTGLPTHVYLIINSGTALAENLRKINNPIRLYGGKKPFLAVLQSIHCFPIIVAAYYMLGAAMFGVLRSRSALNVAMFPLEFTISGGLHNVSGTVRILYAIYLEVMVILVGCTVAILKSAAAEVFDDFAARWHLCVFAA